MPKNVFQEEGTRWRTGVEILGFGSWPAAECPKGSNNKCMGLNNRLSRLSTLVDLQDV